MSTLAPRAEALWRAETRLRTDPASSPDVVALASPAALEADFMTRERSFFERDPGVADDFEMEPAPISVEILERRSWFRRQIFRIMLALCAFTVLAVALHFLR